MTLIYPTLHLLARPDVHPSVLTVTRATPATRVTALGRVESMPANALRHDFDPDTGAYLGWLVEEARTNQVAYSEAMTQAPWITDDATVTIGGTLGPDGVTAVATVTETATTAIHALFQDGVSFVAGQSYAFSVYARSAGRERLQLVLPSPAFGVVQSAVFDLTGGSVGAIEGAALPTVEILADGWYRCAITATATVTTPAPIHLRLRDAGATSTYAGDGARGVHLWGAQVEAGACPTSVIVTTTAPVTRAADRLRVTLSAAVFNPFQGTILARGRVPWGLAGPLVDLSDGTADARLTLTLDGDAGTGGFTVVDGGSIVAALTGAGVTGGSDARLVAAYAGNDFALAANGSAPVTDGTGTVPTVNTLTLGGTGAGTVGPRCWVRQVGLFPRRLSNLDLQSLSA